MNHSVAVKTFHDYHAGQFTSKRKLIPSSRAIHKPKSDSLQIQEYAVHKWERAKIVEWEARGLLREDKSLRVPAATARLTHLDVMRLFGISKLEALKLYPTREVICH